MSGINVSPYSGRRVLVTGGSGAIGSNLVSALVQAGADVIVLDDLSTGYSRLLPDSPNLLFVKGSILDDVELRRCFNERPSFVFHLAAFFANQRSVDYPDHDLSVNGLGTLRVLQYSELAGVDRFIYASSGCSVYGATKVIPTPESELSIHMTSPYQVTKLLGELYVNYFSGTRGLPCVRARFFNSYGPGEVPGQYRNVIPNFIFWALKGQPLPLCNDGAATRDFTYVSDIVRGLLLCGASDRAIGEAINIGSGVETSITEIADLVIDSTASLVRKVNAEQRSWDTKNRICADISTARDLLGYQPAIGIQEGVIRTVQWFKNHWTWIESAAGFPPGRSSAIRSRNSVPR